MCVPHSSRFWLEWVVPHLRSGKVAVELRLTQSNWTYEESSSLLTAQKVKPTEVNFGPTDAVQIILSPSSNYCPRQVILPLKGFASS